MTNITAEQKRLMVALWYDWALDRARGDQLYMLFHADVVSVHPKLAHLNLVDTLSTLSAATFGGTGAFEPQLESGQAL